MILPPEILEAVSSLNVHARAWGSGKLAIYTYKSFIAADYAIEARLVSVPAKCHHCGGSGRYKDWSGVDCGECYRCTNGIVTLNFVETTIGDHRWHHPIHDSGWSVLHAVWDIRSTRYPDQGPGIATLGDGSERLISFVPADGWGPNMPGATRLPADEACRLLNLVERWIAAVVRQREGSRFLLDRAMREMFQYAVDLDPDYSGKCCDCGSPKKRIGLCSGQGMKWRGGWARFLRPMCEACHGMGLYWPQEPAEGQLMPNVLEWLANPGRQRQRLDGYD